MSGGKGKTKRRQIAEKQSDGYKELAMAVLARLQVLGSPDESSQFIAMLISLVIFSSTGASDAATLSGDAKTFMDAVTRSVVESLTEMEKRGHGR